ncbi:hypothetical protein GCM10011506_09310 [Marivirga lumbricoides]|uniref:SnoaL-like domain-containing protein n=1 Tax=Marivirga lumbricoides TaxID=1046115 RepID=A0ABQ1LKB7_9BACT|nr:hypothetical protein GCM10011506_09310 [Marivirga lumbricoides]
MKTSLFILAFFVLAISPQKQELTHKEIIKQYYDAFNHSDFEKVKELIADSIVFTEGDYVMPYSKESFHEKFRWDSVFKPTYKIIELKEHGNQVIATVAVTSLRFKFLKNNPLTCSHKFSFKSGEIVKSEALDCIDADWIVWQKERDTLVKWVSMHHPDLNGFIHDLTMKGAVNYVRAMNLYTNRRDSL